MSYGIGGSSDSCYPGTTVLINKLDLHDQSQLDEAEDFVVGLKSLEFELDPFPAPLDFACYKRLHRFLFGELYEWAGTVRQVDLSKQHTKFCPAEKIESLGEVMFQRVVEMEYFRKLPREDYLSELADFYSSLNYLHPFREGNGRTQRLYFRQLVHQGGYTLDFSAVDSDLLMLATIHAASGVQDTLLGVFDQILK